MALIDSGLQPERTRLAWQRTTLTALASLLVILRLLVDVSPLLAGLAAGWTVLALAIPVWSATRWQVQHPTLDDVHRTDGRAPAVLALIVGLACVAAFGYVVLG